MRKWDIAQIVFRKPRGRPREETAPYHQCFPTVLIYRTLTWPRVRANSGKLAGTCSVQVRPVLMNEKLILSGGSLADVP